MKIAVYSIKPFEIPFLEKSNEGKFDLKLIQKPLNDETVKEANDCEGVSVFTNDDCSAGVLKALKDSGVKYIATRATGYDNIDLGKASELGIKVANVPEYSPYAIAEHAVAMILAMNRKLIQSDRLVKDYDFRLDNLIGFDLNGKTAGVIGAGKIGAIVLKILNGFGCKLLAFDPYPDKELEEMGVNFVDLDTLLKRSDIISIHAPLNDKTKHLINKEKFDKMKNGVMLVNTGRGPVIKTEDAIDALKSSKLGYLGLDVYEFEKGLFFKDHRFDPPKDSLFAHLLSFKNVLITGHQAFLTQNALENIEDTTIFNFTCWAENKDSPNEVIN